MIPRRHFLSVAAAMVVPRSLAAETHPVAQYDQQGIHRTGTAVDRASAEWLAGHVQTAGLVPELQPFHLSRVDPGSCFVDAGGTRIDGLPMFDGTFTGLAGITGRLGAEIGFIEVAPNNEGGPLLELRRSGKHKAIIAATKGGGSGISPVNSGSFTHPYGPPVLMVGRETADSLRALATVQTEVRVTVQVGRTEVDAFNVVAVRKGRNSALLPLVVMTPRSGWWNCAGERGGGLYCWLELMRAVSEPVRDVIFVASSGHELGHLGLQNFIRGRGTIIKDSQAWIHFGANIGAVAGNAGTMQFSDETMQSLAMKEIADTGMKVNQRPLGQTPAGEAGNIHRGGGRYVSLVGGNELFHSQADRWPQAVNPEALSKLAHAFSAIGQNLAGA